MNILSYLGFSKTSSVKFKNKIQQVTAKLEKVAHKTVDLAYKLAKGDEVYKIHEKTTIEDLKNKGWEILCNSSEFNDTNQYGYKSVVFVNKTNKEVFVATAGTATDIHDLKDDIYVAAGSFPSKVMQVKAMLDHVVESLPDDASNYKFNVAGHSLGAVLTDILAFEIMSRSLKLNKSITFDSPGSRNAINEAIGAKIFANHVDISIEDLAKHCVIYNSKHNIINYNPVKDCPHITAPKLVLPVKKISNDTSTQHISESSGILEYASYLVSKVNFNIVKTCSDYLGITRVLTELENLKGHSLKNFADMYENNVVVSTQDWHKTDDGKLVINNFEKLQNVTSTGNDVITLDIVENEGYLLVEKYEYDYNDLQRVSSADGFQECKPLIAELGDYNIIT